MLTASDLNKLFDNYAEQMLVPLGFKKSGIHYYKQDGGQYYAIIKHTFRGFFLDYCITYSHEAAGAQYLRLLKKPSSMLKDYPVSVTMEDLKIIYDNNEKLIDSPYYFFSLSREYKINSKCEEDLHANDKYFSKLIERHELLTSDNMYLENYLESLFKIVGNEGLKFYNECGFELCYKSVLRPLKQKKMQQYSKHYQDYLNSFDEYCKVNKIEKPISASY